jgi:hypothetical protein
LIDSQLKMVAEKIVKQGEDERVSVERDIREARTQLDQAISSGNLNESLQSMISYIQSNDLNDAFLGPVSDDDHSRWIVAYAPTTPGTETESTHINNVEAERNMAQTGCCTIT